MSPSIYTMRIRKSLGILNFVFHAKSAKMKKTGPILYHEILKRIKQSSGLFRE